MKKIVINTFGSLGDLHPYIAIGKELKLLGYKVIIATSENYQKIVELHGLEFYKVGPRVSHYIEDEYFAKKAMDLKNGSGFLLKEIIFPNIKETYNDLLNIVLTADLLITSFISYAGHIVAEKTKIPWISCTLAPNIYLSKYDPPILPLSPFFQHFYSLGEHFNDCLFYCIKKLATLSYKPVYEFRKSINLNKGKDIIFENIHSPYLSLSLFSKYFAKKQLDWPTNNVITGFCFMDENNDIINADLKSFLEHSKTPPILITLGSAAVNLGKMFYETCIEVLENMGLNCIVLVGKNDIKYNNSSSILMLDYAPYNQIFKYAKFIVNQGGIGTVANTLRFGKYMLGVPFSHDQPDNCFRIKRMGLGDVLYYANFSKKTFKIKMDKMIKNQNNYDKNASIISNQINSENGTKNAVEEINKLIIKLNI